ncbi:MAG: aldo/keto reductase, partial [Candidatus Bathyarchaeia archaeon]
MRYRRLGRTGLVVSEVSFGAHMDEVNVKDEKRRAEQVTAGLEHGINLFDIYDHSGYKQWAPMSRLLQPIRDKVVISLCTVWDADKVLDEVDYALKVFRTGYIDLYRFVLGKNREENEGRLYALLKAKEEGKVKAVGAAVHVPSETLAALRKHGEELDFLMAPVAYCFRRAVREKSLIAREVRDHGVGIVAMKPLWSHTDDRGAGSHMFHLSAPAVQLAGIE